MAYGKETQKKKFVHAGDHKAKKDLPFVKAHARKRKFRMTSEK